MWPVYDYRYAVQSELSDEEILKTIPREPLKYLLKYWNIVRSNELLPTMQEGVFNCVKNEVWPISQLWTLCKYPEFLESLRNGLLTLWKKLPIYSLENNITVGYGSGTKLINMSETILETLGSKFSIVLDDKIIKLSSEALDIFYPILYTEHLLRERWQY